MTLKGAAVSTTKLYSHAVEELELRLGKSPESCSADELKGYLVDLGASLNLSSSALNIRVCGLKYYFREVVHRLDLVVSIPNPRVQRYVTDILTVEEMELILRSCRDMKQKAMIALIFDTGIRVRELIGLRLKDFDKKNRCFTLYNAKGNKIRTLPYSEALRDCLTSYFLSLGNRPSEWLFEPYGSSGKPMNARNIQHLIHEITKRSGVSKRVHPHTFRHTFAVHYINNGGNLLRLKELLGHQHLDTTLHYLKYCSIPLKESISPFQAWTDERKKIMKPRFEVAHILDQFWEQCDKTRFSTHQKRTLGALKACRTAALGGHIDACDACGGIKISYNSCRNRHCPKCQSVEKEMWMIQREEELLPVGYFHVVFTLPHELNLACIHYPDSFYNLLFDAAKYTLLTFAQDPKWLGALPGISMILHTWGQNLSLHPHVHCIVSGGGITTDGKWQQAQNASGKFLFPVKAMSKVFRAYFLKQLNLRFQQGALPLLAPDFEQLKAKVAGKAWIIYAKKPFGGVKNVVEYLGRYTHKIAISNHRILEIQEEGITFSYKDYADKGKKKAMTLAPQEFIRRFAQHILPPRFRRIRHFGFLTNSLKKRLLTIARTALNQPPKPKSTRKERKETALQRLFPQGKNDQCTHCQAGTFQTVGILPPQRAPPPQIAPPSQP